MPLEAALADRSEAVHEHLGSLVSIEDPFVARNDAGWDSGMLVYVPSGVCVPEPIEISVTQSTAASTLNWRTLIVLEEGAEAEVKRKPKQNRRTTKQRVLRVVKWFLIVSLVGTLLLIGAFVYLYQTTSIPDPNKDFQTQTSFVYYADGKTQLGQYATQNRQIISLSDMPKKLQEAVIAAEDRTFWTNSGIDPKGIIRAAFNDARGGATQGASTITQQYVKILYLTQERSLHAQDPRSDPVAEAPEAAEQAQILEGYLNTIYFGRGAYGVQAAAQAYFGVDAKDLNLRQSAVLASVLNNPSQFDPANGKSNKRGLQARYRYVLDGMAVDGHDHRRPRPRRPRSTCRSSRCSRQSSQYGGQKGHMLTLVRQELHHLGFTDDQIDGGGLRVTTTLTPQAMDGGGAGRQAGAARHQRQAAPRRGRHRPARHRRPARLLRRPELPAVPDQLGRGRRHGRLDVQAGLARRGDHRRLLAEEHLGRQLAVHLPRRPRGPQRGRRRRHQLRLGRLVA